MLAYYGHTMRKQGSCLEKEIMQGTMPGARRRRGRPRTAWMDYCTKVAVLDNIKAWTGLSVEESMSITDDTDKWRKYVHGVANPRIEDGCRTEQILASRKQRLFSGMQASISFLFPLCLGYWTKVAVLTRHAIET